MRNALLMTRAWVVALIAVLTVVGAETAQAASRWYKGNLHTHTLVSDGLPTVPLSQEAIDEFCTDPEVMVRVERPGFGWFH